MEPWEIIVASLGFVLAIVVFVKLFKSIKRSVLGTSQDETGTYEEFAFQQSGAQGHASNNVPKKSKSNVKASLRLVKKRALRSNRFDLGKVLTDGDYEELLELALEEWHDATDDLARAREWVVYAMGIGRMYLAQAEAIFPSMPERGDSLAALVQSIHDSEQSENYAEYALAEAARSLEDQGNLGIAMEDLGDDLQEVMESLLGLDLVEQADVDDLDSLEIEITDVDVFDFEEENEPSGEDDGDDSIPENGGELVFFPRTFETGDEDSKENQPPTDVRDDDEEETVADEPDDSGGIEDD